MKFYYPNQLYLLLFLIFFVACDSEDEPEEPKLPEVATTISETEAVTTFTSVEITGAIDENDDEITSYGVVWATSANPTIEDHVALPGENSAQTGAKNRNNRQSQNSDFTVKITDLSPGQTYYFRTFATNKAGTAYGEEISIGTQVFAGTSWEITYLHSEDNTWIANVDFYADGTAFYTEPASPGIYDMWGEWSMDGNILTYDMIPDDENDDSYILTGELSGNEMSGTYSFQDEDKPFTAVLLSTNVEK